MRKSLRSSNRSPIDLYLSLLLDFEFEFEFEIDVHDTMVMCVG